MRLVLCLLTLLATVATTLSACEDDTLYKVGKPAIYDVSGKMDGQASDGGVVEAGADEATAD
jgi:hypothetical protein